MASNSVQLDCAKRAKAWTLSVNWSESDTSIANNTTKITASGSLASSNTGFNALYDSYACHLKLYWHDNNKNTDTLFGDSSFTTAGVGQGGTRTVSGSITVTHKSDGSLSGYVKVAFDAPTTSGGFSPSSSSCSTGWTTCTTIARASSISGLSGNQLGSGVSVTIDRKSSSFTHKVEYKFVNSGWTTASTNAATSCSFTPPVSLASQIPSSVSGALTVRVTTYNGSTQIGDAVTKSINLSVPSTVVPSLSGLSATRIDNDVPSSWGIYVKGISQVKITASGASGSYGSTISGYSISGPGLYTNSSSGTSGQLSSTGTLTYTCTVTDSRGRTASKSVSITVVDYTYPNISMSVERCTSDGTKSTNGTYLRIVINYSIASVSGKNGLYSKSCSCNGVSNTSFASGTAFVLAANCSIGNHYTVNASIRDNVGNTATASAEVTTAYRVLNVNKNKDGLAIGKFSEKAAFEVNMDGYFYGNETVSGKIQTNDLSIGGKWETGRDYGSGGNSSTFVRLCRLTITNAYCNSPIELCYSQRASPSLTVLEIRFANTSSLDPAINSFRYRGYCRAAYIVKASTSAWDIYVNKSESWDAVAVHYWTCRDPNIKLQFIGENAVSVPSGYIRAVNFYMEELRDKLYPVGAVYITYNDNNPGNFLGGTWVRFGEGRTLIGQGTGNDGTNSQTFNANSTGGEYKHKLSISELPSHNHSIGAYWSKQEASGYGLATGNVGFYDRVMVSGSGNSGSTGSDNSHNNVQPYITVYFWRRTA
jgi:hypothetical protein